MSSQGLNSSVFNSNTHYIYVSPASGTGAGIPSGFRVQSSSDYTTQLYQKVIYRNQNPTDQSNSKRLSLKFSRQLCTPPCEDGPFPV